ncbi:DUF4244 domain-containing protein [Promicromonospora kroppenstedtii]|uniref:DUF4244 domain-containing protein n=1 Tax=Promicromonospora kroppenstedtii TaxID=440482 RepID=A0ABW7XLE1_9MICO
MTITTAVACPEPEDRSRTEAGEHESESGLATAEYAIATLAAAAFAGVLMAVLKGGDVKGMLTSLIQSALTTG